MMQFMKRVMRAANVLLVLFAVWMIINILILESQSARVRIIVRAGIPWKAYGGMSINDSYEHIVWTDEFSAEQIYVTDEVADIVLEEIRRSEVWHETSDAQLDRMIYPMEGELVDYHYLMEQLKRANGYYFVWDNVGQRAYGQETLMPYEMPRSYMLVVYFPDSQQFIYVYNLL